MRVLSGLPLLLNAIKFVSICLSLHFQVTNSKQYGKFLFIFRYLFIVTGLAPNELVDYSKRVLLYLGRAQPVKTLEEMMVELQTVETFHCNIERTETPPYYRLTSLRKASSNSDEKVHLTSSRQDLTSTSGTIHTKRHAPEDPHSKESVKNEAKTSSDMMGSLKSAGSMASSVMALSIQRVGEKVRALSGKQFSFNTSY